MNTQTKGKYKFAIGGVCAIITALVMGVLSLLDGGMALIKILTNILTDRYFLRDPLVLINQILANGFEPIANLISVLSLLALGIFLIAKQHKKILLFFPIAGAASALVSALGCVYKVVSGILMFHSSITFLVDEFIVAVGMLIVMAAYAALGVLMFTSCESEKKGNPVLVWASTGAVALGYGVASVAIIVGMVTVTSMVFHSAAILDILRLTMDLSFVVFAVAAVLYAVTFLFTGLWVANPFKKEKKS